MHPASIFIMDVSKSSTILHGEELSEYLTGLEEWIHEWFKDIGPIQLKHRAGDEIIFLAPGYSAAFITSFFISRLWKFRDNRPYFGLAFGNIEKSIEDIDIEKWIHPIVKDARIANDSLKKQKERETFYFNGEKENLDLLTPINTILRLQEALILQQTEIQRLVCSLYLVHEKQNTVAEKLNRSAPTVYSHFKKGHSELVLESYRDIAGILYKLQKKEFGNSMSFQPRLLEEKIQVHIKRHIEKIFDLRSGTRKE